MCAAAPLALGGRDAGGADSTLRSCRAAALARLAPLSLLQPLFFSFFFFVPRRPWPCLRKQSTRCRGSLHHRASTTWWVSALKGHLSCMRRRGKAFTKCTIAAVVVGQLCWDTHKGNFFAPKSWQTQITCGRTDLARDSKEHHEFHINCLALWKLLKPSTLKLGETLVESHSFIHSF